MMSVNVVINILEKCNRFDLLSYREIDVITSNAYTVLPITHVIAVREETPSRYFMCTTPQLWRHVGQCANHGAHASNSNYVPRKERRYHVKSFLDVCWNLLTVNLLLCSWWQKLILCRRKHRVQAFNARLCYTHVDVYIQRYCKLHKFITVKTEATQMHGKYVIETVQLVTFFSKNYF